MNHNLVCPECCGSGKLDCTIGATMRRARKKKHMSLREAAAWIQISHSTLLRFERGNTCLERQYLDVMETIYGIAKAPDPGRLA